MNTIVNLILRIIAFGIGSFLLLQFIFDCDIHSGVGIAALFGCAILVAVAFFCLYKPNKEKWRTA
jgi:hypothetical protein